MLEEVICKKVSLDRYKGVRKIQSQNLSDVSCDVNRNRIISSGACYDMLNHFISFVSGVFDDTGSEIARAARHRDLILGTQV